MTHKSYEVKNGDTLWKICKDAFKLNSDTEIAKKVNEISKKNQISGNSIFVGQKIDLSVTEANSNTYTDNVDIVIFSNNENNIYPETNFVYNQLTDFYWTQFQKPIPDLIIKNGLPCEPLSPERYTLMSNMVTEVTRENSNTETCSPDTIQKLIKTKKYTAEEIETIKNTKEYSQKEIMQIIEEEAKRFGVDPILIKAIVQKESTNQQFAKNKWSGASGLMQLMPKTAKWLGCDNVFDAKQNVRAGVKYLAYLLKKYKGDVSHALGAYNFGEGNYDKYLKGQKKLPKETIAYVPKVMENYNKIATA